MGKYANKPGNPRISRTPYHERFQSHNDSALVAAHLGGEEGAFGEIYRRYSDTVARFIQSQTRDREITEEVLQEAFFCVYRNMDKFTPGRKLLPWLAMIARNITIMHHRRTRSRKFQACWGATFSALESSVPKGLTIEDIFESTEPQPDELYERGEIRDAVIEALGSLQEKIRKPVAMKDLEGFELKEIAEALNIPLGTTKTHIRRGRKLLREKLEARFRSGPK